MDDSNVILWVDLPRGFGPQEKNGELYLHVHNLTHMLRKCLFDTRHEVFKNFCAELWLDAASTDQIVDGVAEGFANARVLVSLCLRGMEWMPYLV
jgi:hypothetical protein